MKLGNVGTAITLRAKSDDSLAVNAHENRQAPFGRIGRLLFARVGRPINNYI